MFENIERLMPHVWQKAEGGLQLVGLGSYLVFACNAEAASSETLRQMTTQCLRRAAWLMDLPDDATLRCWKAGERGAPVFEDVPAGVVKRDLEALLAKEIE